MAVEWPVQKAPSGASDVDSDIEAWLQGVFLGHTCGCELPNAGPFLQAPFPPFRVAAEGSTRLATPQPTPGSSQVLSNPLLASCPGPRLQLLCPAERYYFWL